MNTTPVTSDLGFGAAYCFEILPGLPATGPAPYQFHREGQQSHGEGLVVMVRPLRRDAWVGNFQGSGARTGATGAFATPSQEYTCVVSQGQGYWVRADSPTDYEVIPCDPIRDVRRVPGRELIVFADFTQLVAYGPQGLAWRTEPLCYDDLEIREVQGDRIQCVGWDATVPGGGGQVEFSVDTATGTTSDCP